MENSFPNQAMETSNGGPEIEPYSTESIASMKKVSVLAGYLGKCLFCHVRQGPNRLIFSKPLMHINASQSTALGIAFSLYGNIGTDIFGHLHHVTR